MLPEVFTTFAGAPRRRTPRYRGLAKVETSIGNMLRWTDPEVALSTRGKQRHAGLPLPRGALRWAPTRSNPPAIHRVPNRSGYTRRVRYIVYPPRAPVGLYIDARAILRARRHAGQRAGSFWNPFWA